MPAVLTATPTVSTTKNPVTIRSTETTTMAQAMTTLTSDSIVQASSREATTSVIVNPSVLNDNFSATSTWLYALVGGMVACVVLLAFALVAIAVARRRIRAQLNASNLM